jgi:NADPH-dependent curcumin reductase CurA
MSSTYQAVVLASRPKNNIVPGETFKLITKPTPKASDLKDGEVIFESTYLSLDPAMRGWLNGKSSLPLLSPTPHANPPSP